MEKAGRRLASAAPPRGRFRGRESGARSAPVLPLPIARPPVCRPSSGRSHAWLRQAGHPLPTELEFWAGTRNTQVTGFGMPCVCFWGVLSECPGVPTQKRSVPPPPGDTRMARCTQVQLESTLRKAAGRCGLTHGSSPFLLLPGSRVTSQCRPGLWRGTRAPAVTASPAGDAAWTAALWLLSLGECNLEAEGPC